MAMSVMCPTGVRCAVDAGRWVDIALNGQLPLAGGVTRLCCDAWCISHWATNGDMPIAAGCTAVAAPPLKHSRPSLCAACNLPVDGFPANVRFYNIILFRKSTQTSSAGFARR